jgi:cellulose synthase/poly-beta-1,6-N-acetylglucosamine synthase-like glycosyltransferase
MIKIAISFNKILKMKTIVSPKANFSGIRKLSVIIPCYNEFATVGAILKKVRDVRLIDDIEKEIILVRRSGLKMPLAVSIVL